MRATASHGQGLSITVISQFDFSCFVGCKMVNYMCIHNYIYIYIYTYIIPCYTPMIPYVSWLKEPWFCRRNHLLLAGPLAIRMTPNGWLLLGSWLDNGRLVDATIIIISNHITHWNWGFPIFRQGQQDCTSMGWLWLALHGFSHRIGEATPQTASGSRGHTSDVRDDFEMITPTGASSQLPSGYLT